jgi:hypothetical protein
VLSLISTAEGNTVELGLLDRSGQSVSRTRYLFTGNGFTADGDTVFFGGAEPGLAHISVCTPDQGPTC